MLTMKLFSYNSQVSQTGMEYLVLLVLSLPLASIGYPSPLVENSTNSTDVIPTLKSLQLYRDQDDTVLDDSANEIFRGSPYGGDTLSPSERRGQYCRRRAKCEQLSNNTCLGAQLPYSSSTTSLVLLSREGAMETLRFWERLSHVPKCWAVIQPFLCALYMPRCEDGIVDLPSQEMCKMAASTCRILAEDRHFLPRISPLQCDDINRFPPMCKNDVRELRFNWSTKCMPPLVATDNPSAYFEGVEGCGMQCANPLFTPEELSTIQTTVAWVLGTLLLMSSFTVLSFKIDWRYFNTFPSVAVFYMNLCFMVATLAFLAQFLPGARESIICRKDGTLRMKEPSPGENYYCMVIFILIYYPFVATLIWFAIFTFAWSLQLRSLVAGRIEDRIDKYRAHFHLGAWCVPVLPTIVALALRSVDGNSELGICFISMDPTIRTVLGLSPVVICTSIGIYYSLRVRASLQKVIKGCQEVISEGAGSKIRRSVHRIEICTPLTLLLVIGAVGVHVYEFQDRDSWQTSFRNYVACKIMHHDTVDQMTNVCKMTSKPSVNLIRTQLSIIFLTGFLTNFWLWTPSNCHNWGRFLWKLVNKEDDGERAEKVKKHHVIAWTFAKRQALNRLGRVSISMRSTRDDPIGLNFELNSMASRGMSATWVAALPKLWTRRGALRIAGSTSSQQRNSCDSDMSYGGRVSLESRRHSLDSQLSLALGDLGGRKPVTSLSGVSKGRVKPTRSKRRGKTRRNFIARRSSSTSQDSQLSAQLLSTLAMALPSIQTCVPNMKRRTASAGLPGESPLNYNNGPLFPLFHRNMSEASGTDEEKEPGRERGLVKDTSQDDKESKLRELVTAAVSDSSIISDEDVEAKPDVSVDVGTATVDTATMDTAAAFVENNSTNKRHSEISRRLQNKRYSKHDVLKKSSDEDEPMLNDKEKTKEEDAFDSPLLTAESKSRLKQAREIGTQTSMLSVNEIDAGVPAS